MAWERGWNIVKNDSTYWELTRKNVDRNSSNFLIILLAHFHRNLKVLHPFSAQFFQDTCGLLPDHACVRGISVNSRKLRVGQHYISPPSLLLGVQTPPLIKHRISKKIFLITIFTQYSTYSKNYTTIICNNEENKYSKTQRWILWKYEVWTFETRLFCC